LCPGNICVHAQHAPRLGCAKLVDERMEAAEAVDAKNAHHILFSEAAA
jgi:hypothetical protein